MRLRADATGTEVFHLSTAPYEGGRLASAQDVRLLVALLLVCIGTGIGGAQPRRRGPIRFTATASALHGITAKGTVTHEGTVAADPSVLPLGSRIRVSKAGPYSGEY